MHQLQCPSSDPVSPQTADPLPQRTRRLVQTLRSTKERTPCSPEPTPARMVAGSMSLQRPRERLQASLSSSPGLVPLVIALSHCEGPLGYCTLLSHTSPDNLLFQNVYILKYTVIQSCIFNMPPSQRWQLRRRGPSDGGSVACPFWPPGHVSGSCAEKFSKMEETTTLGQRAHKITTSFVPSPDWLM